MIDVAALRQAIASCPDGHAAIVTKRWLQQVDRDMAELAKLRQQRGLTT